MATSAIEKLTAAFDENFTNRVHAAEGEGPAVVLSWPSVPIEIVRATGLRPVVARGDSAATPAADAHVERGIFPSRLKHLMDAALAGRLSHAARLIIPRTSDPDYKCFLYLREFVRLEIAATVPSTILFDLLQSNGPDVREYNAARTRILFEELAMVSGRRASLDDLRDEIETTNLARAAARRLTAQRRGVPRVTGSEVFSLLGAFWCLPPEDYATLAAEAADDIQSRSPLVGPCVLIAGAPVDCAALHAAIESRGAIVVAEISPWGNEAAGNDVVCEGDPITALSDKYRADVIGPRTPAIAMRNLIARSLEQVDAIVLSLPPEDTAFGWDYPALRRVFERKGIPHTCLYGDPYQPLSDSDAARLEDAITAAETRMEARHG
jgi:benzoyl-CoA reductase/2-hydroxyglutaryl-CoA dehydratase subunit BcrC/BadD/HgdB